MKRHVSMLLLTLFAACDVGAPAPQPIGLTAIHVDSGERKVFRVPGSVVAADTEKANVYAIADDALWRYTIAPGFQAKKLSDLQPTYGGSDKDVAALSPDLKKLAYYGEDYPVDGIWVKEVLSDQPSKRVLEAPNHRFHLLCLRWITDTDLVCALSKAVNKPEYANAILKIHTDTGQSEVLYTGQRFSLTPFSLSPDRGSLAFFEPIGDTGDSCVKILHLENAAVTTAVPSRGLPEMGVLAWSPDGLRLAYDDQYGLAIKTIADNAVLRIRDRNIDFARLYYVAHDRLAAVYFGEGVGGLCYIYDATSGERLRKVKVNTHHAAVVMPARRLLIHGADSIVVNGF